MSDKRVYTAEEAGYVIALRDAEKRIAELESELAAVKEERDDLKWRMEGLEK